MLAEATAPFGYFLPVLHQARQVVRVALANSVLSLQRRAADHATTSAHHTHVISMQVWVLTYKFCSTVSHFVRHSLISACSRYATSRSDKHTVLTVHTDIQTKTPTQIQTERQTYAQLAVDHCLVAQYSRVGGIQRGCFIPPPLRFGTCAQQCALSTILWFTT